MSLDEAIMYEQLTPEEGRRPQEFWEEDLRAQLPPDPT